MYTKTIEMITFVIYILPQLKIFNLKNMSWVNKPLTKNINQKESDHKNKEITHYLGRMSKQTIRN